MSSQGAIYLRHLQLHYNDIRYQNNIVYYKSSILRKDNLNLLGRHNAAQLKIDPSTVFDAILVGGTNTAKFIVNVWDFGRPL